ncbi:MAG: substrate-binding domain-containing protein [Aggregatilineales bacterium]
MSTSNPIQEGKRQKPVPVVLVNAQGQEDKGSPLRFYALLIFFGTLLGTLLGAVADLGEAAQTIERFQEIFNPPPTLCVVGSDTILGLDLQLSADWKREFEARHRVNVDIQPIGSGNGVRRAAEGGCAHVLAMSEPMSRSQYQTLQAAGVQVQCAAPVGYDVIAFVTDINNRLPTLQYRDLSRVLDGRVSNWSILDRSQNVPVTVWARPRQWHDRPHLDALRTALYGRHSGRLPSYGQLRHVQQQRSLPKRDAGHARLALLGECGLDAHQAPALPARLAHPSQR